MTLAELESDGSVDRVEPDPEGALVALEEARNHARSASRIAPDDANGALQLAYDGARKAVMAHMRRTGFRVRRGDGAHVVTAKYAEAAIERELGRELDRMRRRRNRSEYGSTFVSRDDIDQAVEVAQALIARVEEAASSA